MKKFLAILSAISLISLSACENSEKVYEKEVIRETVAVNDNSEEEVTAITEQAVMEKVTIATIEPMTTESIGIEEKTQQCTVGSVTFSVPAEWQPLEENKGTFVSSNEKFIYQLQGESHLGNYTPEEFFDRLIEGYTLSYPVSYSDSELTSISIADGIEAKVGRIDMVVDNVFFSIDVLCVPQKNKAITFAVQAANENDIQTDIREITKTAKINIGTEDYITGNKFIASDSSKLCLDDDNSFKYYQSKDSKDIYCYGTYEVYYGQSAFDKVTAMTEYGLTKDELEKTLNAGMDGYILGSADASSLLGEDADNELFHICKDTFYAVILHNENLVENGNTSSMGNNTLYIGYYLPDYKYADMINVLTAGRVGWTLAE